MQTRIRWRADGVNTLHAVVDGQIAGTLTGSTLKRYPGLYGIGPRALARREFDGRPAA